MEDTVACVRRCYDGELVAQDAESVDLHPTDILFEMFFQRFALYQMYIVDHTSNSRRRIQKTIAANCKRTKRNYKKTIHNNGRWFWSTTNKFK